LETACLWDELRVTDVVDEAPDVVDPAELPVGAVSVAAVALPEAMEAPYAMPPATATEATTPAEAIPMVMARTLRCPMLRF
jgi:hypothetical protein